MFGAPASGLWTPGSIIAWPPTSVLSKQAPRPWLSPSFVLNQGLSLEEVVPNGAWLPGDVWLLYKSEVWFQKISSLAPRFAVGNCGLNPVYQLALLEL